MLVFHLGVFVMLKLYLPIDIFYVLLQLIVAMFNGPYINPANHIFTLILNLLYKRAVDSLWRRTLECQTTWISSNRMSGLIWVQTVCKGQQQMTKIAPCRQRVKCIFFFPVPSSSPSIISISTPSVSVISLSWDPPLYTNGPLLSYRLTVSPLNNSQHEIQNDVPPDTHSWTFGHLYAGQKYEVFVSAVNEEGEGPAHTKYVTTPSAGSCK